jgi:hypothetical protein
LVTHPEIVLGQARLTPEFFIGELLEKKLYLGGMSILSILLSLELGCHNFPLTSLIGITGKRKQLLTCTQKTTRAKHE